MHMVKMMMKVRAVHSMIAYPMMVATSDDDYLNGDADGEDCYDHCNTSRDLHDHWACVCVCMFVCMQACVG